MKLFKRIIRRVIVVSIMSIALGLNFILSPPNVQPFGISPTWVGAIFLTMGLAKLFFLWKHDFDAVGTVMSMSAAVILFWGLLNGVEALQGSISFQMCILYLTIAVLKFFLLTELPSNRTLELLDEVDNELWG